MVLSLYTDDSSL